MATINFPSHTFINHATAVAKRQDSSRNTFRVVLAFHDQSVRDMHKFAMNVDGMEDYIRVQVIDATTAGHLYPTVLATWERDNVPAELPERALVEEIHKFLAGLPADMATKN